MKVRANKYTYALAAIMALMFFSVLLSLRMEFLASRLLPILVGSTVFVLAGIGLIGEFRPKGKHVKKDAAESGEGHIPKWQWRNYAGVLAWVLGLIFFIYLFGFMIAIPVFTLAYMKSHGVKWLTMVISTIVITAATYGILIVVLAGSEIPKGLIPALLSQ